MSVPKILGKCLNLFAAIVPSVGRTRVEIISLRLFRRRNNVKQKIDYLVYWSICSIRLLQ